MRRQICRSVQEAGSLAQADHKTATSIDARCLILDNPASSIQYRVLLLIILIFFALAMDIWAQNPLQKLDPVLKPFVFRSMTGAAPGVPLHKMRPHEPDLISVIIKVSGNPMSIKSAGARVRSVIGDIVTADVPMRSLNNLINLPNVVYIQMSRQLQPALLDVSVPDTRADQVWKSTPGYTGKGVIVGVIDSGIDCRHPDFRDAVGTSRILYIWDQTVHTPGQYPAGYGYGTEWTKTNVVSGQCQEMDVTSHGTHVASTIAGNGGNRHRFTGMSPEADIIVVKSSLDEAEILDAADYIFSRAAELNKSAVINMSFGSHWGPHDGTALLDQAIDELIDRPGRAIVAAAGNSGGDTVHVGTPSLRHPVGENYPWTAIRPSVGAQSIAVQIWYNPAESISVSLLLPENDKGDLGDMGIGWISEGQSRYFLVPSGPLAGAEVMIDHQQPASELLYPNFDCIYIHISDGDDLTIPVDEYIYAIEYDGAGVGFDAYVLWDGNFTTKLPESPSFPNRSFLLEGDGNKTILSPSSATSVICVGSYVTKSEWIDSENRIRTENLKMDDISAFSSRGPLLNGERKPDIAAPGEMIAAAFSADGWDRPRTIYRDGEHVSWRGTSMSAPHVTGAVALMYQQNPNLTASEVKDTLASAAIDRGPVGWDKAWGYGKLDVLAAMGIPSAPRGLKATAHDGSITVTWLPNEESDIAGYVLDAGYSIPGAQASRLQFSIQHPASSYQLTDLPNGVPVHLLVSAYDTSGSEGPKSPEIISYPNPPGPDVTSPEPPRDLAVISINTALELTWSPCREHDLAGYKVYYGTSSQNYDRSVEAGKLTKYRLENLTNGVRLYIAVSSIDTSGNESGKSEEVSAVPQLFPRSELRYQSGWPVSIGHDVYSSPALYDIDGDGRLEVSVSAKDGKVYLLSHNGRNVAGWPISTSFASVSSPALGDIDGDGRVEIVVGAGDFIYAWRTDGTVVPGWPVRTGGSVIASPALGDIDNDGRMEVVIGSRDGRIYALKGDGSPVDGWPVTTYGYVHSSAALGDIDGDSKLEIVVGSGDENMYVFKGDGTTADGWPVYVGSATYSSPAIGDIDGDGGMEVIAADERGWVYAWHYNGDAVKGWPVDLREDIVSSPALGDIDSDKSTLEIVISTRYGLVYALKSYGAIMDGWPVSVIGIVTSSPALSDIDNDGTAEIIVAASTERHYVGLVYAFKSTGKKLGVVWPAYTEGNMNYSSPALGDLDGDGDVELVVGSCRMANGEGGQIHTWDLPGRTTGENILWGGFRHDPRRTGVADDKVPPYFVIAALQNAALKKYFSLYVIASEELITAPILTVTVEGKNSVKSVPLIQIDATSHIYQADFIVEMDGLHTFTVSGTDMSGNIGSSSKTISIQLTQERLMAPANFSLLPNYPNPFNPGTWIPYELAQPGDVTIDIYNASGQLIRSLNLGYRAAGSYISRDTATYWNGADNFGQEVVSGVYFYVLKVVGFRAVRKMTLLK